MAAAEKISSSFGSMAVTSGPLELHVWNLVRR